MFAKKKGQDLKVNLAEKSWLVKIISNQLYDALKDLGNSDVSIRRWQKNRLLQSLMILLFGFGLRIFLLKQNEFVAVDFDFGFSQSFPNLVFGGCLLFSIYFFYSMGHRFIKLHEQWRMNQNVNFNNFIRILIPYLYRVDYGEGLYQIFERTLPRLTADQRDIEMYERLKIPVADTKREVQRLMHEMLADTSSQPFLSFSKRMKGTDESNLLMLELYNLYQGSDDIQTVQLKARDVTEKLMIAIQEIREAKQKRFYIYPTIITLVQLVLIIGYAVAVVVYKIGQINWGF